MGGNWCANRHAGPPPRAGDDGLRPLGRSRSAAAFLVGPGESATKASQGSVGGHYPLNASRRSSPTSPGPQGEGRGIQLTPAVERSLERAIEYITSDEFVEAAQPSPPAQAPPGRPQEGRGDPPDLGTPPHQSAPSRWPGTSEPPADWRASAAWIPTVAVGTVFAPRFSDSTPGRVCGDQAAAAACGSEAASPTQPRRPGLQFRPNLGELHVRYVARANPRGRDADGCRIALGLQPFVGLPARVGGTHSCRQVPRGTRFATESAPPSWPGPGASRPAGGADFRAAATRLRTSASLRTAEGF